MALVLSGERSSAAAASFHPVRFVATWLAALRAGRAQRLALKSLLALDEHRLDDLGISRGDLFDAIRAEQRPTRLLAQRRAAAPANTAIPDFECPGSLPGDPDPAAARRPVS